MAMFSRAFVTGSTGLLGNNLVRALVERGIRVAALARSRAKAEKQFAGLDLDIIEGDLSDVSAFRGALRDAEVLFHTAAYFRDAFTGGRHWDQLYRINVEGTQNLLAAAYEAGIRRMVHTSSVVVLKGMPGKPIDETMERPEDDGIDYYRSKVLADRKVFAFLDAHPDMHITLVLPGWMFGPGDIGPTSAGRLVMDFMNRKLPPGVIPGSFSVVDARDVAACQIAAAGRGRRGERYLAAGRHMTMADLFSALEQVSGIPAPRRHIPMAMFFLLAILNEAYARITSRPVLLSLDTARMIAREAGRTHFNHAKTELELGVAFRPVQETLADVISWYRSNGYLQPHASALSLADRRLASR